MYIIFDIGGTNMRIASCDKNQIIKSKTIATPQDFSQAIWAFEKISKELLSNKTCEYSAGGTPGPLDEKFTKIINAPNLPNWNNKPLKKSLEKILQCPVKILKDVHAAGLGEATYGVAKNKKIVAYLTISTGFGGSRIINGRVDKTTQMAEPGWQIIKPEEPFGYVETLVSGKAMEKIYGKRGEQITDETVWKQASLHIALAIHNTIVHWYPDIIVLGGSLMKSLVIEEIRQNVKNMLCIYKESPLIEQASLGDESGLYGALAYINSKKKGV